jgi:NADPH-dependent 2,4-dienoyl-CoA reductase/sulfur reductase-like enzyme
MDRETARLHPAREGAGEFGYLDPGLKDVVIVGGGLAGLTAGWRLRH